LRTTSTFLLAALMTIRRAVPDANVIQTGSDVALISDSAETPRIDIWSGTLGAYGRVISA
jgi:hypothetical protein